MEMEVEGSDDHYRLPFFLLLVLALRPRLSFDMVLVRPPM
jgi:hypothetical protein